MRVEIDFVKVSGAGNDFVLIDNLSGDKSVDWPGFARAVCSRPFGVGADGLLVIEQSLQTSFLMHYYNADGSFGGMCGNGGRCAARYAVENGTGSSPITFEACGNVYHATVFGRMVELHFPEIVDLPTHQRIQLGDDLDANAWFVNSGSPHIVIPIDAIDSIDVEGIGRRVRSHSLAGPEGANVNFYHKGQHIVLRTYERGVEAETFACGTGAVAAAIVASLADGLAPPVVLRVKSGEELVVSFKRTPSGFSDVRLRGSAHFLFTGTVIYDNLERRLHGPSVLLAEPPR